MGLGLTFWGALFLLITPTLYIEGKVAADTITPSYASTERILKDLDYKGKAFHVPPYPQNAAIPEHLSGLKEMVVFIPKDAQTVQPPSLQELAEGKFRLKNPRGILLSPPGLGLLSAIEQKTNVDFSKTPLQDVCKIMPKYILNDYSLAKEISLNLNENQIHIKMKDSIYQGFYTQTRSQQSLMLLGCPIISSITCALAKSAGKPLVIQKITPTPNGQTVEVQLEIVEGA
jgi:hypothetical protein